MTRPVSHQITLLAAVGICLSISGCDRTPTTHDLLTRYPTPIYSLTGEPLNGGPLGQPKCEDAQAKWLDRVDTDHDGSIDLAELLNNATRQFAIMDVAHTGVLTADGLAAYRAPFFSAPRPPMSTTDPVYDDSAYPQSPNPSSGQNRNRKADAAARPMAIRPPTSQPDPVLAADRNLDFQVTLEEFLAQQRENFVLLDKNNDQRLTPDELTILCRMRERAAVQTH